MRAHVLARHPSGWRSCGQPSGEPHGDRCLCAPSPIQDRCGWDELIQVKVGRDGRRPKPFLAAGQQLRRNALPGAAVPQRR